MNERTVELYKQATEFAYNSIGREHANTAYFQGAITGKFAELIVQECISMADDFECDVNQRGLVDRMKLHFGVEE